MYKVVQYGPILYKYKEIIIVGNIISLRKDGGKTHSYMSQKDYGLKVKL